MNGVGFSMGMVSALHGFHMGAAVHGNPMDRNRLNEDIVENDGAGLGVR